jgi:hypothetical protein
MAFSPGSVGQATCSWPDWAGVQLILVNNSNPLTMPLWPNRVCAEDHVQIGSRPW